jgi:hypothetical protein
MNTLEAGLYTLNHRRYLVDAYSPICIAAGYSAENLGQLPGEDVFFLATAIQGAVKPRTKYVVEGAFGHHDYIGALKSMSQIELRALRERIDFHPIPKFEERYKK